MSVRVTFSNAITFTVINEYGKGAVVQIETVFWPVICCINLPLLRGEYLSSAVNVLTNSLKIFHVSKRDSFQLNYLHTDL